MKGERVTILELEAKLEKDADGSYRRQVMERLTAYLTEVRRNMDSGLSPVLFEKMRKLKAAVETSRSVVDEAWRTFHE